MDEKTFDLDPAHTQQNEEVGSAQEEEIEIMASYNSRDSAESATGEDLTEDQLQADYCSWLLLPLGNPLRANDGSERIVQDTIDGYSAHFDWDIVRTGEWIRPLVVGWVMEG